MLKKFVFVLGCFMVSYGSVSAVTPPIAPADSTNLKGQGNKPYVSHKVKSGETLYGLSRKYGVPVAKIVEANKNVEKSLVIGQVVRIPVMADSTATAKVTATSPAVSPAANRTFEVDTKGQKMHTVQARQTLYSISRLHNVTVDDLKKWNKLAESTVTVGQKLVVGVGEKVPTQSTAAAAKVYVPENDEELTKTKTTNTTPATTTVVTPAPAAPVAKKGAPAPEKVDAEEDKAATKTSEYVSRVNESGMAEQIDQRADANKFLALHKTAPVGTIMAVKNPMNDQTVYVRVIGKLPSTGDNDKIVVKLSKKACQQIGAVDKRFRVEVSYMP